MSFIQTILIAFHIRAGLPAPSPNELIVWNVGQGQWATISQGSYCLHFDMGGEKFKMWQVLDLCGLKSNFAFLSHWDQDHLSDVKSASERLKEFCAYALPGGPVPSEKKMKIFSHVKLCTESLEFVREIFHMEPDEWGQHLTSNDYSRVFEFSNWLIAQGDSPIKEEKIWIQRIVEPEKIRVIVLGHHGSRTSTSAALLRALPHLKMAISSARVARYGHPHIEVLRNLKKFGVACLQTEVWGNIHINF